ncbi:tyrosine-type recombinase/integrase [Embleya sp. MST-111070]|uniref:tyrosine-type recombinase/integrase n=1 Tax=Embleya sp. MST-111070 TaxID=3398231 RepID=UPI003F735584
MTAKKRRPNGASTIYQDKEGTWHGRVTVGTKDDGSPDRRHVRGQTQGVVIDKVRKLENLRDAGNVPKPGKPWTVKLWLTHWVEHISAPSVGVNTIAGYRVAVYHHLIPGLGAHRLDKLTPEHLERFYAKMEKNGSAPATAHQAHRTIRTALNVAVRRGHLARNPASLANAPRLNDDEDTEVEPYSVEEIGRILHIAKQQRNGARWAIALALGLRQGEALGLQWAHVDLDNGLMRVRRNRLRPKYRHGCGDAEPCGRKHAGYCPERVPIRPETKGTKSRAGRRVIAIPDALLAILKQHKEEQERERDKAAQLWHDGGWVFATEVGQPTNPRTDYSHWKRLLTTAGVRDGRLHDARHTAATVLLLLRVPGRVVMAIMGWSSEAMLRRYQHAIEPILKDAARQVDGLLWAPSSDSGEGPEKAN